MSNHISFFIYLLNESGTLKNGGRSAKLQAFPRGRYAMRGGSSANVAIFPPPWGKVCNVADLPGKVCNVADLPGGGGGLQMLQTFRGEGLQGGRVCNTTPASLSNFCIENFSLKEYKLTVQSSSERALPLHAIHVNNFTRALETPDCKRGFVSIDITSNTLKTHA